MEKVFGLKEAQLIGGRRGINIPTLQATLDVLGVPNVVSRQVTEAVAGCRAAIKAAMDKIAAAKAHSANETTRINAAIAALNKELAAVVAATAGVEGNQGVAIKSLESQIATLEKLAKRFGQ